MIQAIRAKVAVGEYEFSQHAVDQSILRRVLVGEIAEAIANGEIMTSMGQAAWCSA
jgi:hypothetical protein